MTRSRLACLMLLLTIALPSAAAPGRGRGPQRDVLFQVATLSGLLDGDYTGRVAFRDVAKRGDFGLGTFEALDGELVVVGGVFYQVRADGLATPVDPRARTPFAAVTFFESDDVLDLDDAPGCAELFDAVAARLPPADLPQAIRITGRFAKLQTRSVPAQSPPFPPLAEALQDQIVFDLYDVEATLVGFWLPAALGEVNVAGFHFHAITADATRGGHVLDCEPDAVRVEIDHTPTLEVKLDDSPPTRPAFPPPGARRNGDRERLPLLHW